MTEHEESAIPRRPRRRRVPSNVPEKEQPALQAEVAAEPTGREAASEGAASPPRRRGRSGRRRPLSTTAADPREDGEGEAADPEIAVVGIVPGQPIVAPGVDVLVGVPRGWARKISAKLIRSVVECALETEGWVRGGTLEVHLLRDDEIREVNATRRGIDEATDVLSFPMLEMKPGAVIAQDFFILPPDSPIHLGEVLVSVDRVETQAVEAGHSTERELAYLTVHGVLHILGYDHEEESERLAMRKREEDVLATLGLRRDSEG